MAKSELAIILVFILQVYSVYRLFLIIVIRDNVIFNFD